MSPVKIKVDNYDALHQALRQSPELIHDAAVSSLKDILTAWQAEAVAEAPMDTGTLRKNIKNKLEVEARDSLNMEAELINNTFRRGFNYSYYQHEVRGNNYLERPAQRNLAAWETKLNSDIRAAVRGAGF